MALTPTQQAAVNYDRNLILFAGPGSGKTSTSVAKSQRILLKPDSRLAMVSFSRAAADEMRHRMLAAFAARQLPAPPNHRLVLGTFNSLSLAQYNRHVRSPAKLLGPPARSALLNSMLSSYSIDERSQFLLSLERYQGALDPGTIDIPPEHEVFIRQYLAKLRDSHSTDLPTIMRECTAMMGKRQIPLLPVSHLLGDEMQDADQIQLEFMLHHSRAGVITTLVADDDQTIYEWRCALGYAGLQHFAREANAKTITLAENFRSREEIVAHATTLIAFNDPDRIPKSQVATRGPGGHLGFLAVGSLQSECAAVAKSIADDQADGGTFAMLARTNRALDSMEEALAGEGVAYHREGPSIWDTAEITTLLSLLSALLSGRSTDLLPILMLLPLDAQCRSELERVLGPHCGDFLDGATPTLSHATAIDVDMVATFCADTARWRRSLQAGELSLVLPDVQEAILGHFQLHWSEHGSSKRMRRAESLLGTAVTTILKMKGTLSRRLSTLSAFRSKDAKDFPVRLMTIHGSKGLEFDTVFLINAAHPDDGKTLVGDDAERRLFYVAMTRAKERFVATYSERPIKYIEEAGLKRLTTI